ncbi:hypothetical protein ABPG72_019947 [Tetrahymena utriculariae]
MAFVAQLLKQLETAGNFENCLIVCGNAQQHNFKILWNKIYSHIPVLFLPPYSPHLNPIELIWSNLKKNLQKKVYQDELTMLRAINEAFSQIPTKVFANCFNHTLKYLKESLLGKPFTGQIQLISDDEEEIL